MAEELFTFEHFAVGESNELAFTAARRVAEAPGAVYNPLLIYGPSGVGKRHLLHAIAHAAGSADPDIQVHLEGAPGLADRVSAGIIQGGLQPLRDALTGLDLLLIDDLESLGGMRRTQLELVAAFRQLLSRGTQVVIASLLEPAALVGFEPELIAILESGLVADIGLPDAGTRRRITLRILAGQNLQWPEETVEALAEYTLHPEVLAARIEALAGAMEEEAPPIPADVHETLAGERRDEDPGDEFGDFLEDVGRVLAAVVETEPWRRRIGEAILRWEGEGIRTRRLDRTLDTEAPPDVDALLDGFARDAQRLLEIRRALGPEGPPVDDPDDLESAERLLAVAGLERAHGVTSAAAQRSAPDPVFLDETRVVLDVLDLQARLVEALD